MGAAETLERPKSRRGGAAPKTGVDGGAPPDPWSPFVAFLCELYRDWERERACKDNE